MDSGFVPRAELTGCPVESGVGRTWGRKSCSPVAGVRESGLYFCHIGKTKELLWQVNWSGVGAGVCVGESLEAGRS